MTVFNKDILEKLIFDEDSTNGDLDLSGIKINATLNPQFFDEQGNLHPKIKNNLLKVTEKFKEHVGIENLHIKDIVMTGSLANYNYNEESDVDVHILSEYSKINNDEDILTKLFKSKKDSWADSYDIKIYGHPVEMYIEDYETAVKKDWVGMYSLTNDKWLIKPEKESKEIDYNTLEKKASELANKIDEIIADHSNNNLSDEEALKKINSTWKKISDLRSKGLNQKHSEFAIENLIYKVLRNNGYFQKMDDLQKLIYDKDFSISENKKKKVLIIKESQYNRLLTKLIKTT